MYLSFVQFIDLDDSIAFIEEYDETLPHLVYAGSDIILCSSFEDPSLQIAVCESILFLFPLSKLRSDVPDVGVDVEFKGLSLFSMMTMVGNLYVNLGVMVDCLS